MAPIPTTVRKRAIKLLCVLTSVVLVGLVYSIIAKSGYGIPCLWYTFTGLRCPGCGISRSLVAMLNLDFIAFLHYNLAMPLILFYMLWVMCIATIHYLRHGIWQYRTPCQWMDVTMLILFLLWGILRNVWGV